MVLLLMHKHARERLPFHQNLRVRHKESTARPERDGRRGNGPSGMGVNLGRAVLGPGSRFCSLKKPEGSAVCLPSRWGLAQRPVLTHDKLNSGCI